MYKNYYEADFARQQMMFKNATISTGYELESSRIKKHYYLDVHKVPNNPKYITKFEDICGMKTSYKDGYIHIEKSFYDIDGIYSAHIIFVDGMGKRHLCNYLSTHTFYENNLERSTKILQMYGFDVTLLRGKR